MAINTDKARSTARKAVYGWLSRKVPGADIKSGDALTKYITGPFKYFYDSVEVAIETALDVNLVMNADWRLEHRDDTVGQITAALVIEIQSA